MMRFYLAPFELQELKNGKLHKSICSLKAKEQFAVGEHKLILRFRLGFILLKLCLPSSRLSGT